MKITVKDVAKHANVSPSSVSRYLNNPNSINAENAFRIKNAIDDLNYTPNPVARSLNSGRSNLIGVIVPSINSYFSLLCRAASDFFYQQGYLVFFCESGENGEKEEYYLQKMLQFSFEGILLSAISTPPKELQRISTLTELVLVDRTVDADVDTVAIDNKQLGGELTRHVISLGYNNILGLFGSSHSKHAQMRLAGAKEVLGEHKDIILTTQMDCYSNDTTYHTIKNSLASLTPPKAIISYGLTVSENTLIALNTLNMRIPDDIFIACWGLNDFKDKYRLALPIVEENPYEMGITASSILLKKIKKQDTGKKAKNYIFPAVLKK